MAGQWRGSRKQANVVAVGPWQLQPLRLGEDILEFRQQGVNDVAPSGEVQPGSLVAGEDVHEFRRQGFNDVAPSGVCKQGRLLLEAPFQQT